MDQWVFPKKENLVTLTDNYGTFITVRNFVEGAKSSLHQVAVATKYCTLSPNICG